MNNRKGMLIVMSGFSGAGKGTIVSRMLEKYDHFCVSISMTTRAPREGEVDGKHYFFVTREKFEETIREDGLLEYAQYVSNYYGTPKAYVEEQMAKGIDVILEIEMQGAMKIKEKFPEALLLFVMAPDASILEKRLVGRGTEDEEQVKGRLERAVEEAEGIEAYDYIIVNDDLEASVEEACAIIDAARRTPLRNKKFIEKTREELNVIVERRK